MTIEAMKQALEALEEAVHYTSAPVWSPSMTKECNEAITALRQAIEQAEKQEPVGYLYSWVHSSATGRPDETYTSFAETIEQATRHEANFDIRAIYTAPPQREWVGLTQQEVAELLERGDVAESNEKVGWYVLPYSFASAIEAKLKEKNT